ncbi:MAG: polysaccharide deacetylase family protein, partial [Calditrichia bacterium]|nr:polysaccharide deacetylase family protein [Calditrichia bacterium]
MKNTFKHKFFTLFLFIIISLIFILPFNCSHLTHKMASLMDHSFPGAIYFVNTDKKIVALTIDDGPDSLTTLKILEVLDKYDSKATFFVISSYVLENKDIMTKIVNRGHELGNHMTHDEPSTGLSFSEFKAKFDEAD